MSNKSTKSWKSKENNYYTPEDIKNIIIGDSTIELKYETVAVSFGMLVAVFNFLVNCILFTSKYMLIHSLAIVIAIPLVFLVVAKVTDDVDAYIARRALAIIGPPFLALVWFTSGGYTSVVGITWMIYMVVFNSLVTSGKSSKFYAMYAIVVNIIVLGIVYLNPQLLIPLDRPAMKDAQNMVSVILVCTFFFATVKIQMLITAKEREKLIEKEAEVTAIYEEVIATNEDLKHANTMLAELNERIEQQMETQTSFTSSMNHELRAPLNAVIGTLQILKMKEDFTQDEKASINGAISSGRLMLQIVNDLLDFAKLREGKFEIIEEDFELQRLISNVWGSFEPQAKAKNLDFTIDVENGTFTNLRADDVRIEQILNNLISNAIKYTDKGSVKLSISNTMINGEDAIRMSVKDTGQGMKTNDIDEIAKPYARFNLEKNNKIQGTGLGMNIVRLLIEQMRGSISCETALNVGTEFIVVLPIKVNDKESIYKEGSATAVAEKSVDSDYSQMRFLCVDDTVINLNVFKGLLKKTGANIDTATSGMEAIEKAKKEEYDIIFIDHMMPQMDGIETYHKLRECEFSKEPVYVMLTGNTGDDFRNLYRQEGINYVMEKPILKKKMIDLIDEIKRLQYE